MSGSTKLTPEFAIACGEVASHRSHSQTVAAVVLDFTRQGPKFALLVSVPTKRASARKFARQEVTTWAVRWAVTVAVVVAVPSQV